MKRGSVLLSLILLGWIPRLIAESTWEQARAAYDQGAFPTALEHYLKLRSDAGTSSSLEYNLGNTYMRLGQLPEAIGSYRRALWLNPQNPDARANLERALQESGGRMPPLPTARRLTGLLPPHRWQLALLTFCWLLAGVLILNRISPRMRAIAPWSLPSLVTACLLTALGVWASNPSPLEQEAVLQGDTVTARFEPLEDATAHFTLPGGSVVRIGETSRNWVRITSDDKKGWIPAAQQIRLSEL